jgi:hypothetical protein
MAAAGPLAVVTAINDIIADPNNANNTVFIWTHKLLFCGPVPLEEQGEASVDNASTKNQIKAAINAAIVASVAAKGFSITDQRILTIADIAG